MDDNVLRVGIGGPVGSGKTALIEALVPLLIRSGRRPSVITNDIYTQEDAQHIRRTLEGILEPERVVGVETGACPHTAVRDDPTMNLAAGAEMLERFPDTDTLFYESGGDNLTLTFSPALVDIFLFVLDTAEGEKMPVSAARASPTPTCWSSTRSTSPSTYARTSASWNPTPIGCGRTARSCSRTV